MQKAIEAVPGLVVTNRAQADAAIHWLYKVASIYYNKGPQLIYLVQEARRGRVPDPLPPGADKDHASILLQRVLQFEAKGGGS